MTVPATVPAAGRVACCPFCRDVHVRVELVGASVYCIACPFAESRASFEARPLATRSRVRPLTFAETAHVRGGTRPAPMTAGDWAVMAAASLAYTPRYP